jgi:hypothetical protein
MGSSALGLQVRGWLQYQHVRYRNLDTGIPITVFEPEQVLL